MEPVTTFGPVFEDPRGKIGRDGTKERVFRETMTMPDGTKFITFHRFWTQDDAERARERMTS